MLIIYWKEYYTWRLDKKISHVLITNLKLTLDQSISFQMPRKLIIVYRNNEITSERLNFPVTPFTRYFLLSYLYFSIPRLISSPHIIVVLRSYFSLGSPLLPFFQFSLSPKRATSSFRTSVRCSKSGALSIQFADRFYRASHRRRTAVSIGYADGQFREPFTRLELPPFVSRQFRGDTKETFRIRGILPIIRIVIKRCIIYIENVLIKYFILQLKRK